MTGPEVTALDAAVYIIPTDAPEADGTLAWDKTTMVLVTARAGGEQGLGWSYTSRAAAAVVGTLDPNGGTMRPDPGRVGHGMTLRDADAEPFRVPA